MRGGITAPDVQPSSNGRYPRGLTPLNFQAAMLSRLRDRTREISERKQVGDAEGMVNRPETEKRGAGFDWESM